MEQDSNLEKKRITALKYVYDPEVMFFIKTPRVKE